MAKKKAKKKVTKKKVAKKKAKKKAVRAKTTSKELRCFVIMPFGNPKVDSEQAKMLENLYTQWIKPTIEGIRDERSPDSNIICHRADKSEKPGEIISHVIEHLVNADIVIADLTGQNANVFYELGVRHAVHNNTILIAQNIKDIPFDLSSLRTIEYSYDPEGMLLFKDRLTDAIEMILTETKDIDNPVRRYLYDKAVHDLISQAVPPGFDAVRSMATEIVVLRKEFEQYARQTRQIMESIIEPKTEGSLVAASNSDKLKDFEGIWRTSYGSIYCARLIDGQLFIPYSYAGDDYLTGQYYNCILIENVIYVKFRWFNSPIFGYAFYRLVSPNQVVGGWWYDRDVPSHVRSDLTQISESIPGMKPIVWKKQPATKKFPAWAEDYFKRKLYEA